MKIFVRPKTWITVVLKPEETVVSFTEDDLEENVINTITNPLDTPITFNIENKFNYPIYVEDRTKKSTRPTIADIEKLPDLTVPITEHVTKSENVRVKEVKEKGATNIDFKLPLGATADVTDVTQKKDKLTSEERSRIGRLGAQARWRKHKKNVEKPKYTPRNLTRRVK